jgi:hypothetical protein
MIMVIVALVVGYGQGRAEIIQQCIEHRAFTYGDGAWGCVRLRKSVRDMGRDEVIPQGDKVDG